MYVCACNTCIYCHFFPLLPASRLLCSPAVSLFFLLVIWNIFLFVFGFCFATLSCFCTLTVQCLVLLSSGVPAPKEVLDHS